MKFPLSAFLMILMPLAVSQGCETKEPSESTQWVESDDVSVAIRISVVNATVHGKGPIEIRAEFRNVGKTPITVLRPFGDRYMAESVGLKVWDRQKRIRYTGATLTYFLGAKSFAVVGPGEKIDDVIALKDDSFVGIGAPGTYTLRYDYSSDGRWDSVARTHKFNTPWRGTICSREITVRRVAVRDD